MQALPEPGNYDSLSVETQRAIHNWRAELHAQYEQNDRQDRKLGLWVRGARRSGTTYTASAAVKHVVQRQNREDTGIKAWEYIACVDLAELVSQGWDETARISPNDDAAWYDAIDAEQRLDRLWRQCDLLWVDDVHAGNTTSSFFRRYLFPKLEYRIKNGQAVVVSTSMEDRHLEALLPVVHDLFVIVDAKRPVEV